MKKEEQMKILQELLSTADCGIHAESEDFDDAKFLSKRAVFCGYTMTKMLPRKTPFVVTNSMSKALSPC